MPLLAVPNTPPTIPGVPDTPAEGRRKVAPSIGFRGNGRDAAGQRCFQVHASPDSVLTLS